MHKEDNIFLRSKYDFKYQGNAAKLRQTKSEVTLSHATREFVRSLMLLMSVSLTERDQNNFKRWKHTVNPLVL